MNPKWTGGAKGTKKTERTKKFIWEYNTKEDLSVNPTWAEGAKGTKMKIEKYRQWKTRENIKVDRRDKRDKRD